MLTNLKLDCMWLVYNGMLRTQVTGTEVMVRAEDPLLEWPVVSEPRQALEPPVPEPEGLTDQQQQQQPPPMLTSSESAKAPSTILDDKSSAGTPTSLESVAER